MPPLLPGGPCGYQSGIKAAMSLCLFMSLGYVGAVVWYARKHAEQRSLACKTKRNEHDFFCSNDYFMWFFWCGVGEFKLDVHTTQRLLLGYIENSQESSENAWI